MRALIKKGKGETGKAGFRIEDFGFSGLKAKGTRLKGKNERSIHMLYTIYLMPFNPGEMSKRKREKTKYRISRRKPSLTGNTEHRISKF